MRIRPLIQPIIVAAFGAALAASQAQATTLSGTLTADNLFTAYLSTDDSVLGTSIVSGNDWPQSYTFPATALTPGVTNYLHVIAQDQGYIFMFMGQFSLSDTNFSFNNGTQSLLTNTNDWKASQYLGSWLAPTGVPVSYGTNPLCCMPWGHNTMTGAEYIWDANPNSNLIADFSTPIFANATATPLPAALPLFASGLGALGLLGWRRKRKNAAALAA